MSDDCEDFVRDSELEDQEEDDEDQDSSSSSSDEEEYVRYSRDWWLHLLGLDDDAEDAFDPEEIDQLMKDIDQMVDSTYLMTKCLTNIAAI
jgi:hypothetical protein